MEHGAAATEGVPDEGPVAPGRGAAAGAPTDDRRTDHPTAQPTDDSTGGDGTGDDGAPPVPFVAAEDWRPDPYGRFAERFFLAGRPSLLVRDDSGAEQIDPPDPDDEPEDPSPDDQPVIEAAQARTPEPLLPWEVAPRRRGRARRAVGVLVLAGVVAGAGAWAREARPWEEPWAQRLGPLTELIAGPDHPSSWDPAVADLVPFVETARGLTFDHPVHVRFLAPEAFATELAAGALPADGRADGTGGAAAVLRALGVPTAPATAPGADGTGGATTGPTGPTGPARYRPSTAEILVPVADPAAADPADLVRALTLALLDQRFDLGPIEAALVATGPDPGVGAEATGLLALADADARRIADRFRARSADPAAPATPLAPPAPVAPSAADGGLPTGPSTVAATFGPALVDSLVVAGTARLDEAFRDPPRTDAAVVWPTDVLEGHPVARASAPAFAAGEPTSATAEASIGAHGLYVALAGRLDPTDALGATFGYVADRAVAFDRDGAPCTRLRVLTDGPAAAERLRTALGRWVAAGPPGAAEVTAEGAAAVLLDACAVAGTPAPADLDGKLAAFVAHARTSTALRTGGMPREAAMCTAVGVVASFPATDLLAGTVPPERLDEATGAAARFCGAPGA